MASNFENVKNMSFGRKQVAFQISLIENTPLDHGLTMMTRRLQVEVNKIMENMETADEDDPFILDIIKLVNAVELLEEHFDIVRKMVSSCGAERVEQIKKEHPHVAQDYVWVTTKDDIAQLPGQYSLGILHDKLLLPLKLWVRKGFKKNRDGEYVAIKNIHNHAIIKILESRFLVACYHYPRVLRYPKDDIFCQPKTSVLWQDIFKNAVFTSILTQKQIIRSFKSLYLLSNLAHIIIKKISECPGECPFRATLALIHEVLYYGARKEKATTRALLHLINPKIEEAFQAWNLVDHPVVTTLMWLRLPIIGHDELIYIPRLYPRLTKEVILREYEEGTINKIVPVDLTPYDYPDIQCKKEDILKCITTKTEDKIPIRILAPDYIDFTHTGKMSINGYLSKLKNKIYSMNPFGSIKPDRPTAIVIHYHGGGFIAMSSAYVRIFLSRWVTYLNIVHFVVDYRLAPKNPYPDALDDSIQSYLWITKYAEEVLGIKNGKVIVSGDSAGGNIAIAVALRLIKDGIRPPDGCLLIYPCLELDPDYSSPSVFLSVDDPMIHTSLLKICIKAYVGKEFDAVKDPFISPVVASDELLAKLPPVRIISGSEDPLQDGNWRLVAKLRKLEKDIKIIVHEHLSHAFMCHQDLKNFEAFIADTCEQIRELIEINNPHDDRQDQR